MVAGAHELTNLAGVDDWEGFQLLLVAASHKLINHLIHRHDLLAQHESNGILWILPIDWLIDLCSKLVSSYLLIAADAIDDDVVSLFTALLQPLSYVPLCLKKNSSYVPWHADTHMSRLVIRIDFFFFWNG